MSPAKLDAQAALEAVKAAQEAELAEILAKHAAEFERKKRELEEAATLVEEEAAGIPDDESLAVVVQALRLGTQFSCTL